VQVRLTGDNLKPAQTLLWTDKGVADLHVGGDFDDYGQPAAGDRLTNQQLTKLAEDMKQPSHAMAWKILIEEKLARPVNMIWTSIGIEELQANGDFEALGSPVEGSPVTIGHILAFQHIMESSSDLEAIETLLGDDIVRAEPKKKFLSSIFELAPFG